MLTAFTVPAAPATAKPAVTVPPAALVANKKQKSEDSALKAVPKIAAATSALITSKPDSTAPASYATLVKKVKQPSSEQADVASAVDAWVKAWGEKDMDAYVAAYENGYHGNGTKSHAAWVRLRKARIFGKDSIENDIQNQKVEVDGDTAVVTFRQLYTGGTVKSDDLKTLTFKKKSGKWKITKDTTAT